MALTQGDKEKMIRLNLLILGVAIYIIVICCGWVLATKSEDFPLVLCSALLAVSGQAIATIRKVNAGTFNITSLYNFGWSGYISYYISPAVMAIMLYLSFIAGALSGSLVPQFSFSSGQIPSHCTFYEFLSVSPSTAKDIALVLIYAFLTGFATPSVLKMFESAFGVSEKSDTSENGKTTPSSCANSPKSPPVAPPGQVPSLPSPQSKPASLPPGKGGPDVVPDLGSPGGS